MLLQQFNPKYAIITIVIVCISAFSISYVNNLKDNIKTLENENKDLTISFQKEKINEIVLQNAIDNQNLYIDNIKVDEKIKKEKFDNALSDITNNRDKLIKQLDIKPKEVYKYVDCNDTNTKEVNEALNILLDGGK